MRRFARVLEPQKLYVSLGSVASPPLHVRTSANPAILYCASTIGARLRQNRDGLSIHRKAGTPAPSLLLEAPERFCSMTIRCNNDIQIDSIKEANLAVKSFCGAVTLGSASCESAKLSAHAGVAARKVSGAAEVYAASGEITIKHFVGSSLFARAAAGRFVSNATYATDATIQAPYGVQVSELRVDGHVHLECDAHQSGSINIGSVTGTGCLVAVTQGGNVSLQVASSSLNVAIHTHGGDAHISSGVITRVFVRSKHNDQEEYLLGSASEARASEFSYGETNAIVFTDVANGTAHLREESWTAMMQEKLRKHFEEKNEG